MSNELEYPQSLGYSSEHIWVKKEGDLLEMGITSFAQTQLGEVVYVEMPEAGDRFEAGDVFGSIESFKTVSELYMPVSGTIDQVNQDLEGQPSLVNSHPYAEGWILRVKDADADELDKLLDAHAYKAGLAG